MKSNIIREFNLPGYVKGKTFAEASKAIDSKFKDREDPHSEATKKELLERLSQAQEYLKMKEDAKNGVMQPGMGEQPMPGQMAFGGTVQQGFAEGASVEEQSAAMSGIAGMAGTGLELGMQAFGDSGVDTTGLSGRQAKTNVGMGAVGGAMKGAQAGMALGPWGAAAGAVIGGAAGFLGGNKANKDAQIANRNAGLIENNKFTNDFFKGGPLPKNPFADINLDVNTPQLGTQDIKMGPTGVVQLDPTKPSWSMNPGGVTNTTKPDWQMGQTDTTYKGQTVPDNKVLPKADMSWLKENYGSMLNAAPIAMNAYQLSQLEKADGFRYDRLDSRYKENQIDERSLENRVQNEARGAVGALTNASNGSAGALRSGIIGSQLQKTNALSDAYLKANQMNAEDRKFGQQFNAQADAINQRTGMLETNERRADDAAYGTAKSLLLGQLGENIGDFGKEANYKKMAIESTNYSWDGKYYVDKDGKKINAEQYAKLKEAEAIKRSKGL